MAVSGNVRFDISITETSSTGTAGTGKDVITLDGTPYKINNTAGVRAWTKTASGTLALVASTPQEIDLSALVTAIGTKNFSTVQYLELKSNSSSATATVTIAKGTSNGWEAPFSASGTVTIYGGGRLIIERPLTTGYTVDGTHKTIKFTPSAADHSITYFIAGT